MNTYSLRSDPPEHGQSTIPRNAQVLLDAVSEGVCLLDAEGRCTFVNRSVERLTGWSADELLGKDLRCLLHSPVPGNSNFGRTSSLQDVTLRTGRNSTNNREYFRRKDGSLFPVELRLNALAEYGEVNGTMVTFSDLSDQLRLEEELVVRERQLNAFFRGATAGLAVLDRDLRFAQVNSTLADLNGVPPEAHVGRKLRDLAPNLAPALEPLLRRVLATGQPIQNFEIEGYTAAGSGKRCFIQSFFPIPGSNGATESVGVIVVEITDRKRTEEDLTAAKQKMAALFDGARDAIFIADAQTGILLDVNEEASRLVNLPKQSIVGRHQTELHPPESAEVYRRRFRESVSQENPQPVQVELLTSDQRRIPVEVSARALRLPNGRLVMQGVFRDITERIKATEELRILSRAVEHSPASVVITDAAGQIQYVNPKFTEITGYSAAEVRGKNPRILGSGRTPQGTYASMWATLNAGSEWRGEFHNRKKNGEPFLEAASISSIRDSEGRITHFVAVKEDITAQRQAQERLRQQAALLDQTGDAVLVLDLQRRITYHNQKALQLYDQDANGITGALADELLFPASPASCQNICKHVLKQGSWSGEVVHGPSWARGRVVQSRWILVRNSAGDPVSFLVADTDMTEQRRLESQCLHSQRMESLGTLASGVAHDLNNILAPILMATDLLRMRFTEPEDLEVLAMLSEGAHRGAAIVKQLLIFGRGVDFQCSELQPRTLLKEIARVIKETFPKSIGLDPEFPHDLWTIQADPTQIHQVLLNLCVNARDAMPQGGRLGLCAENRVITDEDEPAEPGIRPGHYVVLHVTDNGCGILPEMLDKIFDPFFTTKEPGMGTGLGLSTVMGIVKKHEGYIRVQSEAGRGSHFRVFLPAAPGQAAAVPAPIVPDAARGDNRCVLVVDDEEPLRRVVKRLLESRGYRVVEAANGAEGIVLFSQRPDEFDAVITDMSMPFMDGTSLIRCLRQLSGSVPIIGMSGLPMEQEENRVAGFHLNAFLSKPFKEWELLGQLHQLIEQGRKS